MLNCYLKVPSFDDFSWIIIMAKQVLFAIPIACNVSKVEYIITECESVFTLNPKIMLSFSYHVFFKNISSYMIYAEKYNNSFYFLVELNK